MKPLDVELEIPAYYRDYVNELRGAAFIDKLKQQSGTTESLLTSLTQDQWEFAYAAGKWTLKEVILHLTDAERIFAYRALRFSRNDSTPLPGFEENDYVPMCESSSRTPASVIEEYSTLRQSTVSLFENFSDTMLERTGTANGQTISVRAIGMVIAGHEIHHLKVISERYLTTG
ncbi:MAG TPA: DinB family protein [Bacteroidia bacterium]|nr:DinB family protein [Bacteroidia bacterium]